MSSKRSKPVPEHITKEIDTWPSHAAGRSYASSNILVSNNRLFVLSEAETKIPNLIPKPKFLQYLEDSISASISKINPCDVDGRLQIFREAFVTLLATFKTYGPILTQIYREYESAFSYYKTEAQKLRSAKEYLWTIYQECDERILAMQKRERPEMEDLRHKIYKLKGIISEQKEEQTLMQLEIDKLQKSLEEEHARYRHESDARHLLITEINAMRNQYNELENVARQTQSVAKEAGDPTLLRIALDNAKKAQSEAEFEVTRLKADYVDIVPKKQYESLLKLQQEQEIQLQEQSIKYNEVVNTLRECQEQLAAITAERDEHFNALQQLTTTSTPRPDWDEVGRKLPCGQTKWIEDTRGMTSREIVKHLIDQMEVIGGEDLHQPRIIEPKGFDEPVPRFLRCDDQVYRRLIQLRDCLLLTHEIWTYRKNEREVVKDVLHTRRKSLSRGRMSQARATPTTSTSRTPTVSSTFDEALENFFNQTFSLKQIRLEWAYGFYDGLTKYKDCIALDELRKIIDDEMDEACHWHLQLWIGKVKCYLIAMAETEDSESANHVHNSIKQATLENALSMVTGERFESKLNTLVRYAVDGSARAREKQTAMTDSKEEVRSTSDQTEPVTSGEAPGSAKQGVVEDIEELFRQDPGEDYNPFLRELIGLYQAIKSNYIEEILTELHKSVDHENQGQRVYTAQLMHAIETVSPTTAVTTEQRSRNSRVAFTGTPLPMDVRTSVDWITRTAFNQKNDTDSISMETLITRIAGANLYPVVENY